MFDNDFWKSQVLVFLHALIGGYWIAVVFQLFPRQAWTNINPDTFIHGALATWGTWILAFYHVERIRAKKAIKEKENL